MQFRIADNVMRDTAIEGHATMTNLFSFTFPYVGRLFAQRDTVTLQRYALEALDGPNTAREFLLCLGALRLYFTPASALRRELD